MTDDPITEQRKFEKWRRLGQNKGKTLEDFRALPSRHENAPPAPEKPKPVLHFAEVRNGLVTCPQCGHLMGFDHVDFYDTLTSAMKAEYSKEIERIMSLLKEHADPETIRHWVEKFVMVGIRLKYEGHRLSGRDLKDMTASYRGLGEDLDLITPRSRRIGNRKGESEISEILARRIKSLQDLRKRREADPE